MPKHCRAKPQPPNPLNLEKIFSPVARQLKSVQKCLTALGKGTSPVLKKVVRKVVIRQGKLIRPGIMLLIASHYGHRGRREIAAASALETIHLASLIHDDIIDGSTLRRGQKTALTIFGLEFSLLLGDFLFLQSINSFLNLTDRKITKKLVESTRLMVEGEIEELANSFNLNLKESQYFRIIEKKTARLFQTGCEIACLLSQAPEKEKKALRKYGLNLGLVFQIVDDLLDLVGNPRETGKPRFSDLKEGRITLPFILALKKADPKTKKGFKQLLLRINNRKSPNQNNFLSLLKVMENTGSLQLSFKLAQEIADQARSAVKKLQPSPYRQSLLELVDFVLYRKK